MNLESYLSWGCECVHAWAHCTPWVLFLGHCSLFGARFFAGLENSLIRLGWVASKSQRSVCLFQYWDNKDMALHPAFPCGLHVPLFSIVVATLGDSVSCPSWAFIWLPPSCPLLSLWAVISYAGLQLFMCMCVLPAHLSVYHVCALVSLEVRMGHQIPRNWSYRLLWVTMLVLEIKPGSSRRATGTFNSWAIAPAPAYNRYPVFICFFQSYC